MHQFDVIRLKGGELAVVIQNDLLNHFSTRVVVPLVPSTEARPTSRLHPLLRVGRRNYIVATEQMTAIRATDVVAVFGTAKNIEFEIRRAVDVVFMGV